LEDPDRLKALLLWHENIGDHQVCRGSATGGNPLPAIVRLFHDIAVVLQHHAQHAAKLIIIVNEENPRHT
jgi:tryptophan synthase beta subunit